mmetsp:Transcript_800/g.1430  ORF Transcript_800/g.1430 Transcript_800/m.1430 type:complete len:207 (+) Transcript_800:2449-3069(+)
MDKLNANGTSAGLEERNGLRVDILGDKELVLLSLLSLEGKGHLHSLGGGGTLVEKTSAGHGETSEIRDEGLEVEQHLQPALTDLGLVGGVGGVPSWVLQHVAEDDGGDNSVIVSLTDEGLVDDILREYLLQVLDRLSLSHGRLHIKRLVGKYIGRDGRLDHPFHGIKTNHAEHVLRVGRRRANVTSRKIILQRKGIGRKATGNVNT